MDLTWRTADAPSLINFIFVIILLRRGIFQVSFRLFTSYRVALLMHSIRIFECAALGLRSRQRNVRKRGLKSPDSNGALMSEIHSTYVYVLVRSNIIRFLTILIQHRMLATQIEIPITFSISKKKKSESLSLFVFKMSTTYRCQK